MNVFQTLVPWCLGVFVLYSTTLGQTAGTGGLQGQVAKSSSGDPLGGVQITLIPLVENAPPPPPSQRRLVVSDNSGRFSFKDLRPGAYLLETQFEGYFLSSSKPVLAKISTGTTTNVSLAMKPGAVISGRVRDSAGQPVINANVEILRVAYRGNFPVLQTIGGKATDDRGEYRLFWVPAGEYYVAATSRAPVRNARGPQSNETFYPSSSNASNATLLAVKAGEEITGIDIAMRAERLVRISGEIISTVTPPPLPTEQGVFAVIAQAQNRTADVLLIGRDAATPDREQPRYVFVPLSGSSGEFEVPNVSAGSYDLYAIVRDQTAPFALGHVAVDVRDQDVTNVKINIHSGVTVNGSVRMAGNAVATSTLRVLLQPEGTMEKLGLIPPPAAVDAEGKFSAVGIPEGRYRATFQGWLPDDLYVDEVRQNNANVYDSGFDVGDDPPMPIQIIIKSGARSVDGTANSGSTVALVPQTHRENLLRYSMTVADVEGKFAFRGIAPGDYTLFVLENAPDGALVDPKFLSKYEDSGRPIRVNSK